MVSRQAAKALPRKTARRERAGVFLTSLNDLCAGEKGRCSLGGAKKGEMGGRGREWDGGGRDGF